MYDYPKRDNKKQETMLMEVSTKIK